MTIAIIIILMNGISAICCVALYQRKGRNPFGGATLGALLGPLGILVAACVGRPDAEKKHGSFRMTR
jgi:hypothetical protein